MIISIPISLITALLTLFFCATINADGFIKKEVFSYKDKNGNIVFTDKQPTKKKSFKTQTIEAANSTGNNQSEFSPQYEKQASYANNESNNKEQVVRVIVEDNSLTKKKSYKKKQSLKRCKSFKEKFDYYSDKMNSGYTNSEYKKLEKNRKKYKNLLFNNCKTGTVY